MSNDWTVLRLPLPEDGAARDDVLTALTGAVAIERVALQELAGHTDYVATPEARLHRLENRVSFIRPVFLALAGDRDTIDGIRPDDVLGYAAGGLPLADNRHLVDDVEVRVRPDVRRRGIGTSLLDALIAFARSEGRTHLLGWATAPIADEDDPRALRSRTDPIPAERTATAEFALARGFTVAQVERWSLQRVPADPPPAEVAPGYRLESWIGLTAPELRAGFAALWATFTLEAPLGDVALEDESWSAERLEAIEAASADIVERCTTLAIHEASGEVVGASQLFRDLDKHTAAIQGGTMVRKSDRGHGLGLALKRANLRTAKRGWPALERVHTWNAGENDHMWRINEQVGYVTMGAEVGWQWVDPDNAGAANEEKLPRLDSNQEPAD